MVIITLGNRCELVISQKNHLLLNQRHPDGFMVSTIDLGLATEQRIEQIQDSLGRLYIHAVPEEKAVA